MNHVITHVVNAVAFIAELEALAPSYVITDVDSGIKSWTIQHTPLVKNENGSLALSILNDEELMFINGMTTITNLGTYEELFANEASHSLYKSVYPYDVPLSYVDDNGVDVEYFRPTKIGEFAR